MRYSSIACLTLGILCLPALAYDWTTNPGNGSSESPYQISEPNQLIAIGSDANLLDKYFILTNDIIFDPNNNPAHVFSAALIAPDNYPNSYYFEGTCFQGSFDGAGYKVVNLVIDSNRQNDYLGLFGFAWDARISNINVEAAHVNGNVYVGALAGYAYKSLIENCSSTGAVSGCAYIGGLTGSSDRSIISTCYSGCSVTGEEELDPLNTPLSLGGLIGGAVLGNIQNCHAAGAVGGANNNVGGLVGRNYRCDVKSCYATGSVQGNYSVGGLLGQSFDCLVTRSYASGIVDGNDRVGGLVGNFYAEGEISNCYATGSVSGNTDVGGLVGTSEMTVSCSYATGNVQGNQTVGCLIGFNFYQAGIGDGVATNCFWLINGSIPGIGHSTGTLINVTGKTAEQMRMQSTFTGPPTNWDFAGESGNGENDIWRMCVDGVDYPRLSWELALNGDFACGDGVDMADLQTLAGHWLLTKTTNPAHFSYACDANGDEQINLLDFEVLARNW